MNWALYLHINLAKILIIPEVTTNNFKFYKISFKKNIKKKDLL